MSNGPTYLGSVQDVQGATISVALDNNTISGLVFIDGRGYRIGQVGSFVRVPIGLTDLFGIVSQVGAGAVPEALVNVEPYGHRWLRVQLIGESQRAGEFRRGISQYPTINDEAHLVTEDDLGRIYGGAALLRWRPNQSLRRRRGRRQLDPSRRGEERRRVRWPTVLLSSATDGGLPLVLARFVRGLSTHQGSGCLRQLRTAATAAKCHRAPVDSHRVADQMPTGPSMSRRRAPHAASPLPRG